ncbi:MAG: hypothetical protein ABIC57_03295 [bacterium]
MKERPKISSFVEKFADPFLILGIFALFLIPAITVFNLTPIQFSRNNDDSILGVAETELIKFTENIKSEDGIYVSEFVQTDNKGYKLTITHSTHSLGNYKNLIFTAENPTDKEKILKITSQHEVTDPETEVSIVTGNDNYVLLRKDGSLFPVSIYLKPEEKIEAVLNIESPSDVNFSSTLILNIYVD